MVMMRVVLHGGYWLLLGTHLLRPPPLLPLLPRPLRPLPLRLKREMDETRC